MAEVAQIERTGSFTSRKHGGSVVARPAAETPRQKTCTTVSRHHAPVDCVVSPTSCRALAKGHFKREDDLCH